LVHVRSFRNGDLPSLVRLWNEAGLGRGAAPATPVEIFENAVCNRSYFDPRGCLIAEKDGQVAGFGLAGLAVRADRMALDPTRGVVCFVIVHPTMRRQGIGSELVRRLEQYLRTRGVATIEAGPHRGADPYGFGLYGGARPSGFLRSDPLAEPFFLKMGYEAIATYQIHQRDLTQARDPTSARLISIRRQTELASDERPDSPTWWWYEQYGRSEAFRFHLRLKRTGEPVASINVVRLDQYTPIWGVTAVGLVDLDVPAEYRGKGYGQTLLIEAGRQLRQQLVARAEISLPSESPTGIKASTNAGFLFVDEGVAYRLARR
jgi:GNAT superfamily N-acetyltransferase